MAANGYPWTPSKQPSNNNCHGVMTTQWLWDTSCASYVAPISASSLSNLSPCFHGSIFLLSSVSHGRQCIHQITWNQIFHDLRQIPTKIAIQLHHIWVNYNISLTWVVTYPDHITSIAFHVPRPQKTTSAGNPPMFLSDFWPASMSSTLDRKGEFLTNKNRGNKKKHQMIQ